MTAAPIIKQILELSSLRDIKELRNNITRAVDSILGIKTTELIHRVAYRNTSGSDDEPTTLYAYHRTSLHGNIEKEPIPFAELPYSWPASSSFSDIVEKPNVIPMNTDQEIIEYLVFYAPDLKQQSIDNVEALISVYCNQCELILSAEQDQLTGIYNRQAFARITAAMFSTQQTDSLEYHKLEHSACLAIVDLDHFKKVNDRFGHSLGDEVLVLFAKMVKNSLRNSDYIFRYGGEEFVIILNDTDSRRAFDILNRLRLKAENLDYPKIGTITISIGYVPLEKEVGISKTIDMADNALYFSKDNGRNLVSNYYDLRARGLIGDQTTD
jgi:diguanylate cyclase (GGDEF)-like protein